MAKHIPSILVLTGASGVGKTTLVDDLALSLDTDTFQFHHFDSIGVPSFDEMVEEYGSMENWQKAKTFEWVDQLLKIRGAKTLIFEGSTSIAFLQEAFAQHAFSSYQIILIDCSVQEMNRRLIEERDQTELVNEQMGHWLLHLRKQAEDLGLEVLDTNTHSRTEMVKLFIQKFINGKKN